MLFTSDTKVISVLIFDLNESGDLGAIAVLGIIMLVFTFAVVVLINRIPGFGAMRLRPLPLNLLYFLGAALVCALFPVGYVPCSFSSLRGSPGESGGGKS